jgi:hypothetical protein
MTENVLTHITEYKDLLTTVCADDYFDNKIVKFSAVKFSATD